MIPLRLVVDTNIVVSAALKPHGLQRTVLVLAVTRPARLYVTHAVLAEYREVFARPEFKIRKGLRQQLLQLLTNRAHLVEPVRVLQVAKDPDDNKFVERGCCSGRLLDHGQREAFSQVLEEYQGHYVPRIHQHRCPALCPVTRCSM